MRMSDPIFPNTFNLVNVMKTVSNNDEKIEVRLSEPVNACYALNVPCKTKQPSGDKADSHPHFKRVFKRLGP